MFYLFENDTAEFARNLILPPERHSHAKYMHLRFQILWAISIAVGVLVVGLTLSVLSLLERVTFSISTKAKCSKIKYFYKKDRTEH